MFSRGWFFPHSTVSCYLLTGLGPWQVLFLPIASFYNFNNVDVFILGESTSRGMLRFHPRVLNKVIGWRVHQRIGEAAFQQSANVAAPFPFSASLNVIPPQFNVDAFRKKTVGIGASRRMHEFIQISALLDTDHCFLAVLFFGRVGSEHLQIAKKSV